MSALSGRHNALATKKIDDDSTSSGITCSTSSNRSTSRQIGHRAARATTLDDHFPHAHNVGLEVRHSSDAVDPATR